MLRRRIFSGAMASVMALSSVAVVASAEETNYKTKADLEKLVNETYGDAFRTDKLSEYGSDSADAVLDALEHADAVLYDAEADAVDYTAAYMMVEATVARLIIHTAEELQALIDDCTAIYESNNIYNEELQDNIYTVGSYDALVEAYDNANGFVTSTSSVDITEAYEQLAGAKAGLTKLSVVSKSMFRNVMKQYEAMIADEYKYETWRRGTWGAGWTDLNSGNYWILANTTGETTFGMTWEGILSLQDNINVAYEEIDSIKTLTKTSKEEIVNGYKMAQDAVAVYNSWTPDASSRATKSGVNALLKEYHGCLVYDYATTDAEDLYAAIVAKDAEGKDPADEKAKFMAESEFSLVWGAGTSYVGDWANTTKLVDASWTVKPTVSIYVPVDANGYWTGEAMGNSAKDSLEGMAAVKWQRIAANSKFDITKLIAVTVADVTADKDNQLGGNSDKNPDWLSATTANSVMDVAGEWLMGWGQVVKGEETGYDADGKPTGSVILDELSANGYSNAIAFSQAYKLAMDYLAADDDEDYAATIINDIDTTGIIAKDVPTGNTKEWALVYRYLKYALTDKYDASTASDAYTKADVKALIEKAYELAELTGDAAIFDELHMALVTARQDALSWVKEANADKTYKEYTTKYVFGNALSDVDADGDGKKDALECTSTSAYKTLFKAYEDLEKAYNAMKYSFGDIYTKLADVAEMIDDGDLEAKADLMTALDNTAYALSVVADELDEGYDENPAFDVDRVLQTSNRVITHTDDQNPVYINSDVGALYCKADHNTSHFNLMNAYESLLAAIDAQTAPAVILGDVDGNGTVNALDAAALLTAIVDGKALDAAVADYDKSGAVNALDASAILTAIVNG